MNIALSLQVLRACAAAGVDELVLCAGARNAPLVSVLSRARGVKTYSFFEERSAGFFALGRMMATGRPVAVITTSGTAAAELLPAAIEADYQGLPLILLTADRPRRYRGSGAPQTIVQPGLYSSYVERVLDIEGSFEAGEFVVGQRPVHLNVCFDEPLLDETVAEWEWPGVSTTAANRPPFPGTVPPAISQRRPLVLIGGLPPAETARVREIVTSWQRPVYAEGPSQLRGAFPLSVLEKDFRTLDYDCVIRIGSVPTVRLWRDLESSKIPVYHFSHLPFSGLPRAADVNSLAALTHFDFEPWIKPELSSKLPSLLEKYPLSEPGWVNWLSLQLPQSTRLFLGNSLPIREWDLAAAADVRPEIFANRGVNGIDGLISTFHGISDERTSNWCLIGDLTALYDLSGPWALQQRPIADTNIVIINNGGGKIFQRIFNNPLFENRHQLQFADWAKMWGLDYIRLDKPLRLEKARRPRVIEIIPSDEQTAAFWEAWA